MNEHDRAELKRLTRKLRDVIEGVRRENNSPAGSSVHLARAISSMEQAEGLILEHIV